MEILGLHKPIDIFRIAKGTCQRESNFAILVGALFFWPDMVHTGQGTWIRYQGPSYWIRCEQDLVALNICNDKYDPEQVQSGG